MHTIITRCIRLLLFMSVLLTMYRRSLYRICHPSIRFKGQLILVERSRKYTANVSQMITDGNRKLLVYVADWHRKQREFIRLKSFVQFNNFCADEITVYGCVMGRAYEIRTLWVHNGFLGFFYKRQFFKVLFPLCICQCFLALLNKLTTQWKQLLGSS